MGIDVLDRVDTVDRVDVEDFFFAKAISEKQCCRARFEEQVTRRCWTNKELGSK